MNPDIIEKKIQEIDGLRRHARAWRLGAMLGSLALASALLVFLWSASARLLEPGPSNDQFMTDLKAGLQREVTPQLKGLTVQTVRQLVPRVRQEAAKLDTRMPELVNALSTELQTFQNDVPKRVDSVLRVSVVNVVQQSGAKARSLYPDLTDKELQALLATLTDEATRRASNISQHIIAPYTEVLPKMMADLNHIRDTEPVQVANGDLSWEIAAACANLLDDQLRQMPLPSRDQLLAQAVPGPKN